MDDLKDNKLIYDEEIKLLSVELVGIIGNVEMFFKVQLMRISSKQAQNLECHSNLK